MVFILSQQQLRWRDLILCGGQCLVLLRRNINQGNSQDTLGQIKTGVRPCKAAACVGGDSGAVRVRDVGDSCQLCNTRVECGLPASTAQYTVHSTQYSAGRWPVLLPATSLLSQSSWSCSLPSHSSTATQSSHSDMRGTSCCWQSSHGGQTAGMAVGAHHLPEHRQEGAEQVRQQVGQVPESEILGQ